MSEDTFDLFGNAVDSKGRRLDKITVNTLVETKDGTYSGIVKKTTSTLIEVETETGIVNLRPWDVKKCF